ncbi:MAG: AsmA family protein [Pseudomonadales bacterium]|nr:AsmA family protein [Pseudomonadales bacterium]
MKALKVLMGLVGAIFALLVLVVLYVVLVVDPNDYRAELEGLAAEQNVEMSIDGDLSWKFFPKIGVSITQVKVKPQMENLAEPVSIESMLVSVEVMPLLSGEIVADGISLTNGKASLLNKESGQRIAISGLTLEGKGVNTRQQAFPLNLSLKAEIAEPQTSVELDFRGEVSIDKAIQQIKLLPSGANLIVSGDPIGGKTVKLAIGLQADIDLLKQSASLAGLTVEMPNLSVGTDMIVNNFGGDELAYSGQLTVDATNLGDLLVSLGQVAMPTADPAVMKRLTLNMELDGNLKQADIEELNVQLDDTRLTGKVTAKLGGKVPHLMVDIKGDNIDLDRYRAPASTAKTAGKEQAQPAQSGQEPVSINETLAALPGNYRFQFGKIKVMNADISKLDTSATFTEQGTGVAEFLLDSIVLNKVNLTGTVAEGLKLANIQIPAALQQENTMLQNVVMKARIQPNGVIENYDLNAESLCVLVGGKGVVDTSASTYEQNIVINFPSVQGEKACSDLNPKIQNLDWPLVCKGSFGEEGGNSCGANSKGFEKVLARMAGKRVEEEVDKKLTEKLGEQGKKVKDMFKGLFNKD